MTRPAYRWVIDRAGVGYRWSIQKQWQHRDYADWHWLGGGFGHGWALTQRGARRKIVREIRRYEGRFERVAEGRA